VRSRAVAHGELRYHLREKQLLRLDYAQWNTNLY